MQSYPEEEEDEMDADNIPWSKNDIYIYICRPNSSLFVFAMETKTNIYFRGLTNIVLNCDFTILSLVTLLCHSTEQLDE